MTKPKKTRSVIKGRDSVSVLYRAVERYVAERKGTVVVIGGIELQDWPGQPELCFKIAVNCTGRRPKIL